MRRIRVYSALTQDQQFATIIEVVRYHGVYDYELRCRRRRACGWSEVHAAEGVPDACPSCGRDSVYARPIPRRITFHD